MTNGCVWRWTTSEGSLLNASVFLTKILELFWIIWINSEHVMFIFHFRYLGEAQQATITIRRHQHYTAHMVKVLANLCCLFYTSSRHNEILAFIGLIWIILFFRWKKRGFCRDNLSKFLNFVLICETGKVAKRFCAWWKKNRWRKKFWQVRKNYFCVYSVFLIQPQWGWSHKHGRENNMVLILRIVFSNTCQGFCMFLYIWQMVRQI